MRPVVEPLFSAEVIRERIDALAATIASRLEPDAVVVTLLTGAFIFAADLARALANHGATPTLDFMILSSYGHRTESSGEITVRLECAADLNDRQVLLVDDILDSGTTLDHASCLIRARGARELMTCVLLDKPARRALPIEADFVGFQVPNLFVVGYGIDFNQMFRELPFVGAIRTP